MRPFLACARCRVGEMARGAMCGWKAGRLIAIFALIGVVMACSGVTCAGRGEPGMGWLSWNPSSEALVVSRTSPGAGIWVLRRGSPPRSVSRAYGGARWLGNDRLLVSSVDSPWPEALTWELLDLRGGREERMVPESPEVLAWDVSPNGEYLAYVGCWPEAKSVVVHRFSDGRTLGRYDLSLSPFSIAWSPDSRYLYGYASDRDWRLDVAWGRMEEKVRPFSFVATPGGGAFGINDGGQIVGELTYPRGLYVIDWATGRKEQIAAGRFSAVAFGRDPNLFVCVKRTEEFQVEAVLVGRFGDGSWHLSELSGVDAGYGVIAVTRDSKRLAYVASDGSVKVTDVAR